MNWNLTIPHSFTKNDLDTFSPQQKIEFLGQVLDQKPFGIEKLKVMESMYNFNSYENAEIKFLWIRIGLKSNWDNAVTRAEKMLSEQGRISYLKPLYKDLFTNEDTKKIALEIYEKNKASYMHAAIRHVEKILDCEEAADLYSSNDDIAATRDSVSTTTKAPAPAHPIFQK